MYVFILSITPFKKKKNKLKKDGLKNNDKIAEKLVRNKQRDCMLINNICKVVEASLTIFYYDLCEADEPSSLIAHRHLTPLCHFQESGFARQSEEWENQSEASLAAMREEAEILHSTLREITQAVRQDADTTSKLLGSPGVDIEVVDAGLLEGAEDDFLSKRPISPSRAARLRSSSPTRSRSPAVSDNALATVHSAIQKKNMQVMVRIYRTCNSITVKCKVLVKSHTSQGGPHGRSLFRFM